MKAVVCLGQGQISVEDVELDPPRDGEVKLRMSATGVCHSDVSIVNGTIPIELPAVLGHEGAGVVTEVGKGVTNVAPGDHVITTFVPNCGDCFHCIRGEAHLCTAVPPTGYQLDGTSRLKLGGKEIRAMNGLGNMAEEVVCPAISVVPIGADVPMQRAALVGCGVTTGVGAAIKTARVAPGSTVAVFGCGGVGLSVIQGARVAGADRVIAVDQATNKLELAKQFGATDTVDASAVDARKAIAGLTDGIGVDYGFEAIGVPAVIEQAYRSTRRGGTLTVVGIGRLKEKIGLSALMFPVEGKTVHGCMYGSVNPREDFPKLLDLAARGKLDLDGLVTRTYSIDEAPQAFADLESGTNARGMILFD